MIVFSVDPNKFKYTIVGILVWASCGLGSIVCVNVLIEINKNYGTSYYLLAYQNVLYFGTEEGSSYIHPCAVEALKVTQRSIYMFCIIENMP
jgi:hypothetical protein